MKALLLILALALAGCATDGQPRIETKIVTVPVNVPCKANVSADPAYPDTDAALKAAPNVLVRIQLLVAGRLARIAREVELKAAVKACAGD